MYHELIIVLLVIILINNTRYGVLFGDLLYNGVKWGEHLIKRIARTIRERVKR